MAYIQDYRTFYGISDDVDDYDLSWKIYNEKPEYSAAGVDFNTFSENIGAEKDRFDVSSFTKGLKSGALGLAATVPAVISLGANILGADEIAQDFAESAQNLQEKGAEYRPRTEFKELFTNPTVAGVFDQVFYQLGNIGPSMLLGGVGGIVGRTAVKAIAGQVTKGLVKNLLTKRANKILATSAGKKLIASKGLSVARKQALLTSGAQIGTGIGVMGAVSPMEVGQNYLEDVERHGVEDASPIKSILTGTVAGSLELLGGHFRLLNRVLGNKVATKAVSNAARGKWSQVGRVLKEAATIGGQEALQELGQEELSLLNVLWTSDEIERSNLDYWSEENMLRRGESAFAGLVAGAIPGAGSGVVNEIKRSGLDSDVIESKTKELLQPEGISEEIADDPTDRELGKLPDGPLRTATDRQAYISLQEALSQFEETPESIAEPIPEDISPEPPPTELPPQRTTEETSVEDQVDAVNDAISAEREENLQSKITPEPQKAATHPVVKELSAVQALGLDKRVEVANQQEAQEVAQESAQQSEIAPEVVPEMDTIVPDVGAGVLEDAPVAKQPWELSDLATTPNILIDRIQARKQPDGKYKLLYRGTRNEVFVGELFNSASEARNFFKAQQIKA